MATIGSGAIRRSFLVHCVKYMSALALLSFVTNDVNGLHVERAVGNLYKREHVKDGGVHTGRDNNLLRGPRMRGGTVVSKPDNTTNFVARLVVCPKGVARGAKNIFCGTVCSGALIKINWIITAASCSTRLGTR